MTWPLELVPILRDHLSRHPAIAHVPDRALERLLTVVFFSSLETEELEHHPIRVAFVGPRPVELVPAVHDAAGASQYRWRALAFRRPRRFDARQLLKLARATGSDRIFTMVALAADALEIVGLAREGHRPDGDDMLTIVARGPGSLEAWVGSTRVIEYVRGFVQTPPEDVLLAAGPVRRAFDSFARAVGSTSSYLGPVASLLRHVAQHAYGGILVVSSEDDVRLADEPGFVIDADVPLCVLLDELRRESAPPGAGAGRLSQPAAKDAMWLVQDALRAEIDRTIAEIGRLTALDGATILDRGLGLRGFGVVLPITPGVVVVEALDAEGSRRVAYALDRRGARHHAAASYAFAHPMSVVFVASADGEVACMLREPGASEVLLWRFRPSDVP